MKLKLSLIFTLTMTVSCTGHDGRSPSPAPAETKVVRDFVQDFYNWYVPVATNIGSGRPADLALQNRPSAFDPALARQLKEDSDAQAKVPDDIVGLDFDPFLAAQDPCERYEVINAEAKAQHYLVAVRGVGGCEQHNAADVIAEVASVNSAWVFVNFHYPGERQSDLLTVLKELRDDRR